MEITKQLRPTTTLAREHAAMPASRKRTRQEADNDDDDTIYGTSKNEMVLSSSSSSLFNNATPPSTNTCFSNQWNDTLPMTAEQEAQVLHDFFTLPLPESSLSCPSSPLLFGGGGIEYSATPNPAVGNFGLVSPSPTLATLEKKDAVKEDQARDCQVEEEENIHTVSPQNDAPRSCTIVVGETQVVLPPFSISTLQQNLKASSNPALLRLACMIEVCACALCNMRYALCNMRYTICIIQYALCIMCYACFHLDRYPFCFMRCSHCLNSSF